MRRYLAWLALGLSGCGQVLGLGDFEDQNGSASGGTGATAGTGASSGSAGTGATAGSGGTSGSGGSGGSSGTDGGVDAGVTYECTNDSGEIELVAASFGFGSFNPESIQLVVDLTTKHAFVVVEDNGSTSSKIGAISVDSSNQLAGPVFHSVKGFSDVLRGIVPFAGSTAANAFNAYVYMARSVVLSGEFDRVQFARTAGGALNGGTTPTSFVENTNPPCSGPESKSRVVAGVVRGSDVFVAMSCNESFSASTSLSVGKIGDTFGASSIAGTNAIGRVPFQLIATQSNRVLQTKAPATYRYGATQAEFDQEFNLDLSQGATDTTVALGIAPSADEKGVVVAAARFDNTNKGELWTGEVAESKLLDLGSAQPKFLQQGPAISHDKVAGGAAWGSNGIFVPAPSAAGTKVVAHWLGRDGTPRVVSYPIASTQASRTVTAVRSAVTADAGDSQSAIVLWLEAKDADMRVKMKRITCGPVTK